MIKRSVKIMLWTMYAIISTTIIIMMLLIALEHWHFVSAEQIEAMRNLK